MNPSFIIIIVLIAIKSFTISASPSPTTDSSDYDDDDDFDDTPAPSPPPDFPPSSRPEPPRETSFTQCSSGLEKMYPLFRQTLKSLSEIVLADNVEIGNSIVVRLNEQLTEAEQIMLSWESYKKVMPAALNADVQEEARMAYRELVGILYGRIWHGILAPSSTELTGRLSLETQEKIKKELKLAGSLVQQFVCLKELQSDGVLINPRDTSDAINERVKGGQRQG